MVETLILLWSLGFLLIGLSAGGWLEKRSLLTRNQNPENRTPHKLGANFYYIVPEKEYNLYRRLLLVQKSLSGK